MRAGREFDRAGLATTFQRQDHWPAVDQATAPSATKSMMRSLTATGCRKRSQLSVTGYTAYPGAKRSPASFGVIEIGDDGWILDPTAATPGRPPN